ncbi:hypothetical protein J437_LFUL017034 [Ladona fulva]|uniref:PiggyBac transposable element-derived protein domain-containing protein n=1 Tax=Ladona fulva TaxID=123851 RepID=A0A8K0KLI4_LADFU|nr:hypothetical protein J437_LFUL017034 [Ladona fulva]
MTRKILLALKTFKGCLGYEQFLPLKSAKLGIKTFELCESKSGYLWNFMVYTGSGSEITYNMENFYNFPYLSSLLRKHGVNVAGTLRLYRKDVPVCVKDKKLKWGESITYESNRVEVEGQERRGNDFLVSQ